MIISDMKIKEIKKVNDLTIIYLSGGIMGGIAGVKLTEKFEELINEKRCQKIILDLKAVSWMNSSGLGIITSLLTEAKKLNVQFKLAGVTERIISLFMITKLLSVFDIYKTVEEAIESFEGE